MLVEIGGTVGDIEGLPFFEAIRQLGQELPRGQCHLHPPDAAALHPDGGRAEDQADPALGRGAALDRHPARHPAVPHATGAIPRDERRKLALFCNVRETRRDPGAGRRLDLRRAARPTTRRASTRKCWPPSASTTRRRPDLSRWTTISERVTNPEGEVTIAVVGKYTGLKDAYKSLIEALHHGGIANNVKVNLDWIESEIFEREDPAPYLEGVHGILVPGGFGERGAEGKIRAARFARERKIPYFGICFGMQMAVIEAARNLAGIKDANSTEFGPTPEPVVGLMTEWLRGNELEKRAAGGDLGGTMRLGAYQAQLCAAARRVAEIYGGTRHLRAPPPPLRGQHGLPGPARGQGAALLRRLAGRACCPRSSSTRTIPGSSACSSTRS